MDDISSEEKSKLCLQCLECCKWLGVPTSLNLNFPPNREFYATRGARFSEFGKDQMVVVQSTCQHLTPTGCAIYETRPLACRFYDGRKDPIVADRCLWLPQNRKEDKQ